MNIRKGDTVIVIAGSDRGKTGVVQLVHPEQETAVVEGVNVRKKHVKPTQAVPEGSIKDVYVPVHVSNLALIDPKTGRPTRVHHKIVDGRKIRVADSGASLDEKK